MKTDDDWRRYEYEIGGKIRGRVYKGERWNFATFDGFGVSRYHGQGPTMAKCKQVIEKAFNK